MLFFLASKKKLFRKKFKLILLISSVLFIGILMHKTHDDFFYYHFPYITSLIEFKKRFDEINSNHTIVILSEDFNMNEKNISFFLEVTKIQKTNNKSFVVVKNGIDIDKISELLNITPTLVEAEDILEIEAIERDLLK